MGLKKKKREKNPKWFTLHLGFSPEVVPYEMGSINGSGWDPWRWMIVEELLSDKCCNFITAISVIPASFRNVFWAERQQVAGAEFLLR